jgi:hypothetical protein
MCYLINSNCPYDVIVERDLLIKMRMGFDFNEMKLTAYGKTVAMKLKHFYENPFAALLDLVQDYDNTEESAMEENMSVIATYYNTPKEITESHYERVDVDAVVKEQTHLSAEQWDKLSTTFRKRNKLFSGKLGFYPHKKMDLELLPGAKPVHSRPYPVPYAHQVVFKKDLDRLTEIGMLTRIGATKWAAPTFITPKKDGPVSWVSDFSALNKVIKRKIYPLVPRIQDILSC